MQASSVTAVVVTHNRQRDLERCLEALRAQTHPLTAIIVVDNASTDATAPFLAQQPDTTIVTLATNTGGAGGFKAGMAAASETHTQWWWLMDDDCVPDSDSLAKLCHAVSDGLANVGAAVPMVMYSNGDQVCGYVRSDFRKQQSTRDTLEVDWAPFVGLLLRSVACREVGAVRSDFFISHDDKEYCLRMRMNGWTLRAAPCAVVRHPRNDPQSTHRIFGMEVSVPNKPPWREYYAVRNSVIVDRLTRSSAVCSGRSLPRLVVAEARMLARLMLRPRANGRRAWMRIRGLIDSLLGRTGARILP